MRLRVLVAITVILAAGAAFWWLRSGGPDGRSAPRAGTAAALTAKPAQGPGGATRPDPASGVRSPAAPEDLFVTGAAGIDPHRPESNRWELANLHGQLRTLPRGEAARQLQAFLRSGADAPTGLRLRVGRGGWLETAPTLRVAALDWLAEFDPQAAYDYAGEIFASSNSADEWALALRNYYWKTQTADAIFIARVTEELGRESWLQNPSAGLAESIDFPVAIGGAEGYEILKTVMAKSAALRQAALAAVDAWVIAQRATAIPLLAAEASTADAVDAGSRAALLARADVRDDAQRAAVVAYLESAGVPPDAKAEFLRQFPNQSMILGNHLVTNLRPMTLQESARLDVAALQFVDQIIQAGSYPELGGELAASRQRLSGFVDSARRGGVL